MVTRVSVQEKQMSTPADNTRHRQASGKKFFTHLREIKQKKKLQVSKIKEKRSNSLVRNWLASTELIDTSGRKFNLTAINTKSNTGGVKQDKIDKCKQIEVKSNRCNELPDQTVHGSSDTIDSVVSFNYKRATKGSPLIKDLASKRLTSKMQQENTVQAMSTTDRKLKNLRKRLAEEHDQESDSHSERSVDYADGESENASRRDESDSGNQEAPTGEEDEVNTLQVQEEEDEKIVDEYKCRLKAQDMTVLYEVSDKIESIENAMDYFGQSLDDMSSDFNEMADMNIKLVQSTIKCDKVIDSTNVKLQDVLRRINKGAITIQGIDVDNSKTIKENVTEFLKSKMKFKEPPEVQSAHVMGRRSNSPIWVRLLDPDDVFFVFKHLGNLKDETNEDGKGYRVRMFQEEEDRANDIRKQEIVAENRALPISHQVTATLNKGELRINNEKYVKQIRPPTTKDFLLSTPEESKQIKDTAIFKGPKKQMNGSNFYSYMVEVKSMQEIKHAYSVLKHEHFASTHIMCGYRLFGARFYNLQDYSDDGEHFGGKAILDSIKEMKVWNLAVFIVRYHNGPNLGQTRFKIIRELTKEILSSYPKTLNYGLKSKDQALIKAFGKIQDNKQKRLLASGSRGRGANRSGRGGYNTRQSRQNINQTEQEESAETELIP